MASADDPETDAARERDTAGDDGEYGYRAGFRTQREEVTDERLPVEGTIPAWLRGDYLANGPGQFEVGGTDLEHWFDPLAMLRRFRFDDDGVVYANRFVRSRDFAYARSEGKVRTPFPGTPPDRPVWERVRQTLTGVFPDNPVIGVQRAGDQHLAVTESPWGLAFDPDTLETTGRVDLAAGTGADLTLAHVHHDPDRDRFLNLGVSYGRETTFTLFERPADVPVGESEPEPIARLRFEAAPYVHSFALTADHVVVTVNAFGLDPAALLTGALTRDTFLDAFGPIDAPTRFVVLDRDTGEHVRTVEAPPAFVYHHANAFERDDEIVVDAVAFADERAVTGLALENLRSAAPDLPAGDLVRWRLSLGDGDAEDATSDDRPRVERETLHEGPVEFPVVNYRAVGGTEHRYVYLAETDPGSGSLPTDLTKVDVETGRVRRWRESGTHPGEPVFVPAPDAGNEDSEARGVPGSRTQSGDDGVLLTVLLEPAADRSTLVVLDAATLEERARAPLPHRLPYGFHGQFYGEHAPGRTMP